MPFFQFVCMRLMTVFACFTDKGKRDTEKRDNIIASRRSSPMATCAELRQQDGDVLLTFGR